MMARYGPPAWLIRFLRSETCLTSETRKPFAEGKLVCQFGRAL